MKFIRLIKLFDINTHTSCSSIQNIYFIFALFASSVYCVVEAILVLKHLFIKGPNTDVLRALYEDVFWMSLQQTSSKYCQGSFMFIGCAYRAIQRRNKEAIWTSPRRLQGASSEYLQARPRDIGKYVYWGYEQRSEVCWAHPQEFENGFPLTQHLRLFECTQNVIFRRTQDVCQGRLPVMVESFLGCWQGKPPNVIYRTTADVLSMMA